MMASDPQVGNSAEATATAPSDPEPAIKISPDPQDADPEPSRLNGTPPPLEHPDQKHLSDIVDDLVNSAEVSISGSDTEASRSDLSKKDGLDKGHLRSLSSVKKPASFKSVSVNKTFLASKTSTSPAPSKVGEKTAPPTGLAASQHNPSASSARPRLVAKTGSSLRDATARAAAAANGGKPTGAPDPNVVWNKNRPPEPKKFTDEELKKYGIHMASRLAPDEAKGQGNWADIEDDDEDWGDTITWTDGTKITIPHPDEHIPVPATITHDQALQGPTKEVKAPTKARSPARVESPSVRPASLGSGKGLVLKGAPEKPTLVAKPPAPPTPVKSPWAPLPPINKASPVLMDLPASQSTSRFSARDHQHPVNSITPPPAKEIAADDFSRSQWRDGPAHQTRELFNSQSGRYEPVPDRRGSLRSEAQARQPAVLQRPHQVDTSGPAEPSAAFQTSRVSGQEQPYGRRRGSSNVSGGSGSFMHRVGKAHDLPFPPHDAGDARRGSMTAGGDIPVSSSNFTPASRFHGNQPWQPRASPGTIHAVPLSENISQPSAPPPMEPAPAQAPPPQVKSEYEYQKKLMRERLELAKKRRDEEEARLEAEKQERIRLKLEALGPPPERKSAKKESVRDHGAAPQVSGQKVSPVSHAETAGDEAKGSDNTALPSHDRTTAPKADASEKPEQSLHEGDSHDPGHKLVSSKHTDTTGSSPEHENARPWQKAVPNQPDQFWGLGGHPGSRSVWAPSSHRALGNGTFNAELGRLSDPYSSQPASINNTTGPGAIAPPKHSHTAVEQPISRPPPIGKGRPSHAPGQVSALDWLKQEQAGGAVANWGDMNAEERRKYWVASAAERDDTLRQEAMKRSDEYQDAIEARGMSVQDARGAIADTWKPTIIGEDGRRGESAHVSKVVHESTWSTSPENRKSQQVRTSRFFPPGRSEDTVGHVKSARTNSPSPPPPDMPGHPVFDGDVTRPTVTLPRPVVNLPSAEPSPSLEWTIPVPYRDSHAPSSRPTTAASLHANPPRTQEDWQDRIRGLLSADKQRSPKSAAFHHPTSARVSVSTPSRLSFPASFSDEGSYATKPLAEECFEEQEMGSLPVIRMPNKTPEAGWAPAPLPKTMHPKFKLQSVTTADPLFFSPLISGGGNVVRVSFAGMPEAKNIPLPFSQARGGAGSHRRGVGRGHASSTHRGGNKSRESSTFSNEPSPSPGPNPLPSSSGGHRGRRGGGYRGRTENWTRRPSAPLQT